LKLPFAHTSQEESFRVNPALQVHAALPASASALSSQTEQIDEAAVE
jgi:hypothetical protein